MATLHLKGYQESLRYPTKMKACQKMEKKQKTNKRKIELNKRR